MRIRERAVLFGRERNLVGISCRPLETEPGRPAVVFLNSGIVHRIGGNRIYVRLARALAREGVASLRFDLAGVGDSPIPPNAPAMSPAERTILDIDDALEFATSHLGAESFVIAGLCSGADNALRTMGRDARVVGSILLDLNAHRTRGYWIRHYLRRATRLESWANVISGRNSILRRLFSKTKTSASEDAEDESVTLLPNAVLPLDLMRDHVERIRDRGGRLLCIFTAGLEFQYNYERQFVEMFPGFDFGESLELHYYGDSDHTFSRQHLQERLEGHVTEWIRTVTLPLPSSSPSEDTVGAPS